MSIKLMSQVWDKEFTHSEQSILLAMADYAGDDGRNCYPSYDRIAWKTGYSERQVQRIIKDMVAKGILVIVKAPTQHQSTQYWIRLEKAENKPAFRVDTVSIVDESRVDTMSTLESRVDICDNPGWTSAKSRVDMVSPDPLVNHHLEPSVKDHNNDDDHARERGDVVKAYHQNIGVITSLVGEQLNALIDEVGHISVQAGILAASVQSKRTFAYVQTCARNNANGVEKPAKQGIPVTAWSRSGNQGVNAMREYRESRGFE